MKTFKKMARQGDVLFIDKNTPTLTKDTEERLFKKRPPVLAKAKDNRIAAALGESSGHAHAFKDVDSVEMYYNKDVQETVKHLQTKKEVLLSHEEHEAIQVPAKFDGAVLIQNEYRLNKIQRMID